MTSGSSGRGDVTVTLRARYMYRRQIRGGITRARPGWTSDRFQDPAGGSQSGDAVAPKAKVGAIRSNHGGRSRSW